MLDNSYQPASSGQPVDEGTGVWPADAAGLLDLPEEEGLLAGCAAVGLTVGSVRPALGTVAGLTLKGANVRDGDGDAVPKGFGDPAAGRGEAGTDLEPAGPRPGAWPGAGAGWVR